MKVGVVISRHGVVFQEQPDGSLVVYSENPYIELYNFRWNGDVKFNCRGVAMFGESSIAGWVVQIGKWTESFIVLGSATSINGGYNGWSKYFRFAPHTIFDFDWGCIDQHFTAAHSLCSLGENNLCRKSSNSVRCIIDDPCSVIFDIRNKRMCL